MIGAEGEGVKEAPATPPPPSARPTTRIPAWRLTLLAAACASVVWLYIGPGVVALKSPAGTTITSYGLQGIRQVTEGEQARTVSYEGLSALARETGNASPEEVRAFERQRSAGLLALEFLVLAFLALWAGALAVWSAQPLRGELTFTVAAALLLFAVVTFWVLTASTIRSVGGHSLATYATVPTWLAIVLFLANACIAALRVRRLGSTGRQRATRQRSAPQADTTECPRCAETIKARATMCRFCNLELPSTAVLAPAESTVVPPRTARGPSPKAAAVLALLLPGLGHMYGLRPVLGVILATAFIIAACVWFGSMGDDRLLVLTPILTAFWLLQAAHAYRSVLRSGTRAESSTPP